MSSPCIGEPVSWLRLERFQLGEVEEAERAAIAEHLAACPACAACLAHLQDDDAHALPPLSIPERARRGVLARLPVRAVAVVGALAAGAALFVGLRGHEHRGEMEQARLGESRIKGDAIAFTLVRDDDERIAGAAGVYRDGDRFKVVVTCPPGAGVALDVVVYDAGGASFPLEAASRLACGNDVPLPGAFRLSGGSDETVCLVWSRGAPVDRAPLGIRAAAHDEHMLCKTLSAAPSPRH